MLEVGSWVFISIIELSGRPHPTLWKMTQSSVFGSFCLLPSLKQDRFCYILTLWPYMVPLFLVYAAEYTSLGPLRIGAYETQKGFSDVKWESLDKFWLLDVLQDFCWLRNCLWCLCSFCITYGCFLKWWYPQIVHFNWVFHYKPSILGYPYFWKHPYCFYKTVSEWTHLFSGTETSV